MHAYSGWENSNWSFSISVRIKVPRVKPELILVTKKILVDSFLNDRCNYAFSFIVND